MTYKISNKKPKEKKYKVGVWTRKGIPIRVNTFEIEAKSEKEAEKIARKKAIKENPDKPQRYFYVSTY